MKNKKCARRKRTKKRCKNLKKIGGVKKTDNSDLRLIVDALFFIDEQNLEKYVGDKYLSNALRLGNLGKENKEERDVAYEIRKARRTREKENTRYHKTRKKSETKKSQTKKNRK